MNRLAILTVVVIAILVGAAVFAANSVDEGTGFQPGIGGGPEPSVTQGENNTDDASIAQSASMLRIIQDHTLTGSAHLQDIYDGEDTSDTNARLEQNTAELIALVRELSNGKSTDELEQIWKEHMVYYEDYAKALKSGDAEDAVQIKNNLQMSADQLGMVINDLLLNVSEEEIAEEMREHINLTLSIIDAHASDDDSEKLAVSSRATIQAGELAEALLPDN